MAKKTLILYATAGSGHKKAAEAIQKAAAAQGQQTQLVDIVSFMSPLSRRLYSDGYVFLIAHMTWLWGLAYHLSDAQKLTLINVRLRRLMDARLCSRLVDFLSQENPDNVISTQFLASEIVALAKEKRRLQTRLTTVVTDFGVHNFWENPGTDRYCCAADSSRQILMNKGIPGDRITVTGIPIDAKFKKPQDKKEILSGMNLSPDVFTVLIATGGIGIGPIEAIVEDMNKHIQLLVVCGSNKSLQEKLSRKNYPGVRVFGFINDMERLMSASDVIVTKAGGLTVSESLSKGLPMVFFCLIPGQEEINARIMENAGVGFIAPKISQIRQKILLLKDQPSVLEACRRQALALARPDAAERILAAAGI